MILFALFAAIKHLRIDVGDLIVVLFCSGYLSQYPSRLLMLA